jgi:hypothetical protein
LAKAENQNYFSGPEHRDRLRAWRERNPGYWRKRNAAEAVNLNLPIQDLIDTQVIEPLRKYRCLDFEIQDVMAHFSRRLLQLKKGNGTNLGRRADQQSSGT